MAYWTAPEPTTVPCWNKATKTVKIETNAHNTSEYAKQKQNHVLHTDLVRCWACATQGTTRHGGRDDSDNHLQDPTADHYSIDSHCCIVLPLDRRKTTVTDLGFSCGSKKGPHMCIYIYPPLCECQAIQSLGRHPEILPCDCHMSDLPLWVVRAASDLAFVANFLPSYSTEISVVQDTLHRSHKCPSFQKVMQEIVQRFTYFVLVVVLVPVINTDDNHCWRREKIWSFWSVATSLFFMQRLSLLFPAHDRMCGSYMLKRLTWIRNDTAKTKLLGA